MSEHKVKLKERKEYDNGLVKYLVEILYDSDGDGTMETIFEDWYGVNKRQEEFSEDKFNKIFTDFADEKIQEFEGDRGVDHSGKELSV